jgi:hypothetical protein
MSKEPGYETVDGGRRCGSDRNHSCSAAGRSVFLIAGEKFSGQAVKAACYIPNII